MWHVVEIDFIANVIYGLCGVCFGGLAKLSAYRLWICFRYIGDQRQRQGVMMRRVLYLSFFDMV